MLKTLNGKIVGKCKHAEERVLKLWKNELQNLLFKQVMFAIFFVLPHYLQNVNKEPSYMGSSLMAASVTLPLFATLL